MSSSISDNNHSTEAEAPPPLYHLADAVDMNHFFLELQPFWADTLLESYHLIDSLELQTSLTRSFSYCTDPPVIQEPVPVEHHLANPLSLAFLGN
jgi:hypothetical protein